MQDESMTFLDMQTMWSKTSSTRWKVNAEMKLSVQRPEEDGAAKALAMPPSLNFHFAVCAVPLSLSILARLAQHTHM
jgi:hypothetical protein